MTNSQDEKLEKAASLLREADGLLITAGAGMGVDSGLPDFRGRQGSGALTQRFDTMVFSSKMWLTRDVRGASEIGMGLLRTPPEALR
jgi:NAD-dependent SIR2 family protein deacetylase